MIDVFFENNSNFPVDVSALEQVVVRVFLIRGVGDAEVGVHLVDTEEMTYLNQQYKHHQGATDVLTFVQHDPEQPTPGFFETPETARQYGDIFLCFPIIAQEAAEREVSVQEQLEFLIEHGCLHLLGVHHD